MNIKGISEGIIGCLMFGGILFVLFGGFSDEKQKVSPSPVYSEHNPFDITDCKDDPFCSKPLKIEKDIHLQPSNQEEDANENAFYQNVAR